MIFRQFSDSLILKGELFPHPRERGKLVPVLPDTTQLPTCCGTEDIASQTVSPSWAEKCCEVSSYDHWRCWLQHRIGLHRPYHTGSQCDPSRYLWTDRGSGPNQGQSAILELLTELAKHLHMPMEHSSH